MPQAGFRERMVEAAGQRLRCREAGAGRTILGLGSRLTRLHELLAGSCRVVVLDLPPAAAPASAAAALAELGIERCSLLAHGAATRAALAFALQHPEAVEALVLLAPPPFDAADAGELAAHLGEIAAPVLALAGTRDPASPPAAIRVYREAMPNGHFAFVYDAAHELDAERPEAVAALVGDFLERHERFIVNHESGILHP